MIILKFDIESRKRKLLFISWNADQPIYTTQDNIIYELADNRILVVPFGFKTDGATVPWMLRWLFPQMGRYTRASIAHDYLYDYRIGTRSQADLEFLKWMLEDRVPIWKAYTFYYAVRIGGKRWWEN